MILIQECAIIFSKQKIQKHYVADIMKGKYDQTNH